MAGSGGRATKGFFPEGHLPMTTVTMAAGVKASGTESDRLGAGALHVLSLHEKARQNVVHGYFRRTGVGNRVAANSNAMQPSKGV